MKFVKNEFIEPDQTIVESVPNNPFETEDDIKMPSFVEVPQIDQHFEFENDFQEMKPAQIEDTFFAEVMFDPGKRKLIQILFVHVIFSRWIVHFRQWRKGFDTKC